MIQTHQQNILKQRYQIIEIIGKGAMGITYKAQDLQTNTNVAVKAISLRNLTSAKQLELIEREVEVLQKLNHPHIPRYLDYFEVDTETDRVFYLVQELIEGKNLEQWVKQGWRVTETEVKAIAEQLLQVLDYLHNLEPPVIHRDIKPHNLLRTESGKIYLVDFGGIQNAYYTAFHGGSTTVGTFGYMALEQANGKAVPASDLYSLGATLLYVLTHRQPEALSNGLSFDFRSHVKLSEEFADWLEKMLEADVNERFSSAKEALTALKNPKLVREGRLNPYRKLVWLGLVMAILGGVTLFQMNRWWIIYPLKYPVETGLCRDEYITREFFAREKDQNLVKLAADRCLLLGAETGNQDLVKQALTNGADINTYAWKNRKIMNNITDVRIKEDLTTNRERNDLDYDVYEHGTSSEEWVWHYSSPLQRAIWADDKEMVKLLISHGANINTTDYVEDDYFHSRLRSRQTIFSPLVFAIYYQKQEMFEFLITEGADVNYIYQNGNIETLNTPLSLVVGGFLFNSSRDNSYTTKKKLISDQKKAVETLISFGADVNLQDNNGITPLDYAKNTEIIELLKEHGAK